MTPPEAPFDAPWQAQLFAMTVALNEAGMFTWGDWAKRFGPKVQTSEAEAYWFVWSQTLIEMLQISGITDEMRVAQLADKWKAAAQATPHGQEIVLPKRDDQNFN